MSSTMSLLISDVSHNVTVFQMSLVNRDVTSYFRYLSTTMPLLISDVICRPQCHFLFQMSSVNHSVASYFRCHFVFQMTYINHYVTPYFRCHLSTTMSLLISNVIVNHNVTSYFGCHLSTTMSLHIFKCHKVTKLLLAVVRQNTAWYRSISMATSEAPPLGKRSLLKGLVTCNVRVWSCRKYRVKTPALLEGGQSWMLHVSINNKHIKTIFDKQSLCTLLLQRPCIKKLYAIC